VEEPGAAGSARAEATCRRDRRGGAGSYSYRRGSGFPETELGQPRCGVRGWRRAIIGGPKEDRQAGGRGTLAMRMFDFTFSTSPAGFRSKKAAQAAGYFVHRNMPKIDKMKLIKLLYLAERESIEKRGRPMFFDQYFSMKDGLICSSALNGINGQLDHLIWSSYILKTDRKTIKPVGPLTPKDQDQVSKSDLDILDDVQKKFGHMTASQIRHWTHQNCTEYQKVLMGRRPISYRDIYAALKFDDPDKMAELVKEHASLEAAR
jgi:uncharacterized phage-associated protein